MLPPYLHLLRHSSILSLICQNRRSKAFDEIRTARHCKQAGPDFDGINPVFAQTAQNLMAPHNHRDCARMLILAFVTVVFVSILILVVILGLILVGEVPLEVCCARICYTPSSHTVSTEREGERERERERWGGL